LDSFKKPTDRDILERDNVVSAKGNPQSVWQIWYIKWSRETRTYFALRISEEQQLPRIVILGMYMKTLDKSRIGPAEFSYRRFHVLI
jgi:hypothetical protein